MSPAGDRAAVRVGPAGWSYSDWQDLVYPSGSATKRLERVAALFATIEINSTFYRSPSPASALSWARAVAARPGFRFTAKMVGLFTHEDPRTWTLKGRDDYRDGLEPLRERGLLGAVLVQFPWFFEASADNRRRLERIRKAFPEHALVVELRHRSWLEPALLEQISSWGYSFCNLDQPLARDSIPLASHVTGPIGYLRVHGRNAEKWFSRHAQVHERYDYLYSEQEIQDLVAVAETLRQRTEELYVIANNHYAGKGPANALEIQSALTGVVPEIPPTLQQAYPRLARLGAGRR